jgi:surface antigen
MMDSATLEALLNSPNATRIAGAPGQQQARVVTSFDNSLGQLCRIVAQNVTINGQTVQATGTFCRTADGRWALSPRGNY